MAYALNTGFLRTINGVFKLVEMFIVLIVLLITRFGGGGGDPIGWCITYNALYLGIGSTVGFAIIVPAIILTYLLGANPSILEFVINIMGGILFISLGSTVSLCEDSIQKTVGGLSIVLGIVFLADLVYLSFNTKCGNIKQQVENKKTETTNHSTAGTLHIWSISIYAYWPNKTTFACNGIDNECLLLLM